MTATIGAAWLVASESTIRRNAGFWIFLFSNGLWIAWAAYAAAPALIVLQLGLAAMNIRGAASCAHRCCGPGLAIVTAGNASVRKAKSAAIMHTEPARLP